MVNHWELLKLAREQFFPMKVLRAMILAYRWQRRIQLQGIISEPLWPTQGVTAGCWAAMPALGTYLALMLREQQHDYQTIMLLTVHVDDHPGHQGSQGCKNVAFSAETVRLFT